MSTQQVKTRRKGQPTGLSPADFDELLAWQDSEPFLELPVHAEIEHQLRICMEGVESGVLIGERGVGKTRAITELTARIQQEEVLRSDAARPREIVVYEASRTTGAKTGLIDLFQLSHRMEISSSARHFGTPKSLIDGIASAFQERGVALVCIDEAQMIDSANLDLIRQVPDRARVLGHRMGIMLIGNEKLRDSLVEIGQLGQRVATEIRFPKITRSHVAPHLGGFHPHIERLRSELPKRAWGDLEAQLFRAVAGKMRRLVTIIANANQLALRLRRRIDEEILRAAIDKLAPEV